MAGGGEFAFEEFLKLYKDGQDYTGLQNFWLLRQAIHFRTHRLVRASS